MRTTYIAKAADIERKWYVVDATGHTLGRLSSEIAKILRGKTKPIFTPFVDTGDYVIVIMPIKSKLPAKKWIKSYIENIQDTFQVLKRKLSVR